MFFLEISGTIFLAQPSRSYDILCHTIHLNARNVSMMEPS